MTRISRYKKRIRYARWKSKVLAVFFMLLFLPSYQKLTEDGVNLYTIYLNGTQVGVLGDERTAEECLINARRNVASQKDGILLAEVELTTEGSAVLTGTLDDPGDVVARMETVIKSSEKETLSKSYTVKIKQYMVNLATIDEVQELLQAALDRYDESKAYTPVLSYDTSREMAVLAAEAVRTTEAEAPEESNVINCFDGVGIFAQWDKIAKEAEPAGEKDFSDYETGLISMNFADSIEICEAYLQENELTGLEQAISDVTKDQEKEQIYEVKSGDTLSQIAENNGLHMDNLIAINPTLEDENSTIRVGDELIITVPQPELSVDRQEQLYYEEDYEADIIYVDNDEWYTTEKKTLQEPSAGHRKVVAIINYHNNEEVSVDIQKQEVTYEAVPKIVERGTKIPPTYIKPISGGRLSSRFGKRTRPTKGASTYHKGIDWGTPVGTAVMATSGGVVTKAGWGSGYGYVVYIRHPDGKESRYGHLSKILVSAGQSVSQGQKIALSGNTGVSTGPHIHFEILVNGSQVDPFKYLN